MYLCVSVSAYATCHMYNFTLMILCQQTDKQSEIHSMKTKHLNTNTQEIDHVTLPHLYENTTHTSTFIDQTINSIIQKYFIFVLSLFFALYYLIFPMKISIYLSNNLFGYYYLYIYPSFGNLKSVLILKAEIKHEKMSEFHWEK